jgi:hypothetical protein
VNPGAQRVENDIALAAFGNHDHAQRGVVGAQAAQAGDAAQLGQVKADGDHAHVGRPRNRGKGVREVARLDDIADTESIGEEVGKSRTAQRMMISDHNSGYDRIHG